MILILSTFISTDALLPHRSDHLAILADGCVWTVGGLRLQCALIREELHSAFFFRVRKFFPIHKLLFGESFFRAFFG